MQKSSNESAFAVCISADEDSDLERWKVYQVLPDSSAAEVDCLRVVDESGEDYLYPSARFILLDLPAETRDRLMTAANGRD